jgi:hypothetical protein
MAIGFPRAMSRADPKGRSTPWRRLPHFARDGEVISTFHIQESSRAVERGFDDLSNVCSVVANKAPRHIELLLLACLGNALVSLRKRLDL